jgi:hypothetical protein
MTYFGDESFCDVLNRPVVFHGKIMRFANICVKYVDRHIVIYSQLRRQLADDEQGADSLARASPAM